MVGMRCFSLPIIGFILMALLSQFTAAAAAAPAPAPIAPSNDGTMIDQGIAYFLLLLALAVTYLIH